MLVRYFVMLPKELDKLKICHSSADYLGNVTCRYKIFNETGEYLNSNTIVKTYPLSLEIVLEATTIHRFMMLEIVDKRGELLPGTIDILYGDHDNCFGVETAGLTENFNLRSKKILQSSILKNNIVLNNDINTKIFLLNANPTLSSANRSDGSISWEILDSNGEILAKKTEDISSHHLKVLDIKEALGIKSIDLPYFASFVAHGNINIFPISFSYYGNIPTGCEHSQPPNAYYKGTDGGPQKRTVNILRTIPSLFKWRTNVIGLARLFRFT